MTPESEELVARLTADQLLVRLDRVINLSDLLDEELETISFVRDHITALEAEVAGLRAALFLIAHTFTEDSFGGTKAMDGPYYQDIAARALASHQEGKEG